MTRDRSFTRLVVIASAVALLGGWGALVRTHAQTPTASSSQKPKMRSTTQAQRKAAAARRKAAREAAGKAATTTATDTALSPMMKAAAALAAPSVTPTFSLVPGADGMLVPDYFGLVPNYATSPLPYIDGSGALAGGIQKFVDPLPSLPIGQADACTYSGQAADCYEIELREYFQQFHRDLPPTKLRGYVQVKNGVDVAPIQYLGPIIVATRNRPVRVTFRNKLPRSGAGGDLFIPTDTTYMGAGKGPDGVSPYAQNRATLHLHGGTTPWISDGTPHQWTTPAGDATAYPKGVSVKNVPDMPDPTAPQGTLTFYYSNQQSARLMFYHDHAYGITRLNVYAGEAAGYLLTDAVEQDLIARNVLPGVGTPLVIQDKTFVPDGNPTNDPAKYVTNLTGNTFASQLAAQDPTWNSGKWGGFGQLWYPHVYMPNQNPYDLTGANAMGRWDYGPWFWPPLTTIQFQPIANPYANQPGEPPLIPGTPSLSGVPEAFMDTPIVNGKAYPKVDVPAGVVRFRLLNAANDRFLNLSLFVAADKKSPTTAGGGTPVLCNGTGGVPLGDCTEVAMVPFNSTQNGITPFPLEWYTQGLPFSLDDRIGGVPDPRSRGPAMIQIGTEGGFLPAPVVIKNQPINYVYNRRDIVVGNVLQKALFLAPAERADVVVDFTKFAGQTLILYNDSPAPVPASDPRLDYFTGDQDMTDTGGAPSTFPGYGPNIRTVMQIHVAGSGGTGGVDDVDPTVLARLQTEIPKAFAASQDTIIVPQAPYNAAYPAAVYGVFPSDVTAYVRIQDTSHSFTPIGSATPVLADLQPKSIIEDFQLDYGRMNALLGVEIPRTNAVLQTSIPQNYIDPPTELLAFADPGTNVSVTAAGTLGDGTQLWKITHNGVDTHAMHFHMFNVQIINRVGWDGAIRPPDDNELGWKDTIRTNPLEDIIVAIRPIRLLNLPFKLPNSVRPLDVTQPIGSTMGFTDIDPNNNPVTVTNELVNFGWEYVWHCHLLGHEENDMMRGMIMAVPPETPINLAAAFQGTGANRTVRLTWVDNSLNATSFTLQRASDANFTANLLTVPLGNVTTYTDATASTFFYRVFASNTVGLALGTYPTMTANSGFSNVASPPLPVNTVSPTALAFGSQLVGTTSAPRSVTVTNTGNATLSLAAIALGGANASQYALVTGANACPTGASTLAAGASCTVGVTFKPTSAGSKPATLNVNAAAPALSVAVSLSGTGGAPIAIDLAQFGDSSLNSDRISATFRTTVANELVLAFVSADANPPPLANTTVTSVTNTGGAVTWTLVRRANAQLGTAEVWRATMPTARTGTVTAFFNAFVPARSITVVSFTGTGSGAAAIGATGSFSAASGAPTGTIVTQGANSWVWGAGTDWAAATARTVGANQTMVHQTLATVGDTYWVQRQNAATPAAATSVTINDTAPTGDRYNLVVVEIRTP
jgi:FtsP/CotA-like multicopper oxidase with cupredoxin domain